MLEIKIEQEVAMADDMAEVLDRIAELIRQGCTSGYEPEWRLVGEEEEEEEVGVGEDDVEDQIDRLNHYVETGEGDANELESLADNLDFPSLTKQQQVTHNAFRLAIQRNREKGTA